MGDALAPSHEGDFTFADEPPFAVAGGALPSVTQHYALYGEPSGARDNVVLVCHALSGSARVADWWPELVGPGRPLDTRRFCVLGVNILGSCYGSTGPRSINPQTNEPYGADFPPLRIADMVRAQQRLLAHLGIPRLHAVVGGSIGGMQAMSWAVQFPGAVLRCLAVGAAPLNAMGLALSHLQRVAIRSDPKWRNGRYPPDDPPAAGLALARGLAMCTYKSAQLFQERFARRPNRGAESPAERLGDRFDVGGYLDHQGQSFVRRFDANSYLVVSKAQDTFDFGEGEEERRAFARIEAKVTMIGIAGDWLFPPEEVRALAGRMRAAGARADYFELPSMHGHDGFLADMDQLAPLLEAAL
jgi:homoserine O-acetyltransferase